MRYGEEKQLVSYLRDLLDLENRLDAAKIDLISKPDFNLVDAFRLFDYSGRGWSSFEEVRDGLAILKVFPTTSDLELVMQRYDVDRDGCLRYSEFCDLFQTKSPDYAAMLNSRASYYIHKPYYRREEYFNIETRLALEGLFHTHLEVEAKAEYIRQQLRELPQFDLFEAFQTCDIDGSGYISPHELRTLLENHGFYVSHN